MFYYVNGTVAEIEAGLAVIDCSGVGYACATTNYTLSQLKKGERAKLYTYLNVSIYLSDLKRRSKGAFIMENYNVNYSVHLPSYSIGPDCYNEVPYVTRFFGKTAVVLGGETAMEKAKPALLKGVEGSDVELLGFLPYGGDSTYENGDALIANPLVQKADMIFAMV